MKCFHDGCLSTCLYVRKAVVKYEGDDWKYFSFVYCIICIYKSGLQLVNINRKTLIKIMETNNTYSQGILSVFQGFSRGFHGFSRFFNVFQCFSMFFNDFQ